jgi:hypothetical protein
MALVLPSDDSKFGGQARGTCDQLMKTQLPPTCLPVKVRRHPSVSTSRADMLLPPAPHLQVFPDPWRLLHELMAKEEVELGSAALAAGAKGPAGSGKVVTREDICP